MTPDEQQRLNDLRELIEAGDKEIQNGEFADYDFEALRKELLGE